MYPAALQDPFRKESCAEWTDASTIAEKEAFEAGRLVPSSIVQAPGHDF